MNLFYLWTTISGLTALWALWTYGFRALITDRFRFEIAGLLIDLETLVASGHLSSGSVAYRTQRTLLEGLIRVAPNFGLLQMVMSNRHYEDFQKGTPTDPGVLFDASVADLEPVTKEKLIALRERMALLTVRFVLLRLPFWVAMAYVVFFWAYISGAIRRREAPAEALQREAYSSALNSDHVMA